MTDGNKGGKKGAAHAEKKKKREEILTISFLEVLMSVGLYSRREQPRTMKKTHTYHSTP